MVVDSTRRPIRSEYLILGRSRRGGNAELQDETLRLSDVSGTVQRQTGERSAAWDAWVDCYDTWTSLLSAIIIDCTQAGH